MSEKFNQGLAYYNSQNYIEAIDNFEQAKKVDNNNSEIVAYLAFSHNNFSHVLSIKGQWKQAKEQALKALDYMPNLAHAYNNLGNIEMSMGNYVVAEQYFYKCINLNQGVEPAITNLAKVLLIKKDYATANKVLEPIINTNIKAQILSMLIAANTCDFTRLIEYKQKYLNKDLLKLLQPYEAIMLKLDQESYDFVVENFARNIEASLCI